MKKFIFMFSIMFTTLFFTACKTTQTTVSKSTLAGTTWQVYSVMGKTVTAKDYAKGLPDAAFSKDDRINGNGGCNRYSAPYTVGDNGSITFGPMISTKMFCPGGGEEEFMKALGQVNTAKIDGKNLVLSNGNNNVLVFTPKAK